MLPAESHPMSDEFDTQRQGVFGFQVVVRDEVKFGGIAR
jgi:hypothetical protein